MSLADDFFKRFRGLDRVHGVFIIKSKSHKNKLEGKGSTRHTAPTIELWEKHLAGEQGLGIVPITDDATCHWGLIDIDVYTLDHIALLEEIKNLELPLVMCRSKSGGAHLFLFLKDAVNAELVRARLMEWAIALGYPNVEVFPKQVKLASKVDYGNWLNMPYFDHKKTARYGMKLLIENGQAKAHIFNAKEFLDYTSEKAFNEEDLKKFILQQSTDLEEAPPCLQYLCSRGFPEGTRNSGLFNISVYARLKYPDEWKERIDAFNQKYMSPPLSSAEVQQVIKSVDRKKYFYTCADQPIASVCHRTICLTRKYGIGQGNSKEDIGVVLSGLTKIDSTPPTWIITVNGVRIELDSTKYLMTFSAFRELCVERLNIIPHRVKQDIWERLLKELLNKLDIIEAPEDASPEGQLIALVHEFCSTQAQAKTRGEIRLGKPFKEEGYSWFMSNALIKFLSQRKFKEIEKSHEIWNVIRKMDGVKDIKSCNGISTRVWGIPSPNEQTEDYSIPDVTEKEEF